MKVWGAESCVIVSVFSNGEKSTEEGYGVTKMPFGLLHLVLSGDRSFVVNAAKILYASLCAALQSRPHVVHRLNWSQT